MCVYKFDSVGQREGERGNLGEGQLGRVQVAISRQICKGEGGEGGLPRLYPQQAGS